LWSKGDLQTRAFFFVKEASGLQYLAVWDQFKCLWRVAEFSTNCIQMLVSDSVPDFQCERILSMLGGTFVILIWRNFLSKLLPFLSHNYIGLHPHRQGLMGSRYGDLQSSPWLAYLWIVGHPWFLVIIVCN